MKTVNPNISYRNLIFSIKGKKYEVVDEGTLNKIWWWGIRGKEGYFKMPKSELDERLIEYKHENKHILYD